jgi:hypothetical protein
MHLFSWRAAWPLLIAGFGACVALPAHTAPAAAPAREAVADPLDAKAAVPPVRHRSALRGYRSAHEVPATPWREANDTVGRVGGWRAYAREAAAPDGAASAAGPGAHRGHSGTQPK